jgi:hypothetical protein
MVFWALSDHVALLHNFSTVLEEEQMLKFKSKLKVNNITNTLCISNKSTILNLNEKQRLQVTRRFLPKSF